MYKNPATERHLAVLHKYFTESIIVSGEELEDLTKYLYRIIHIEDNYDYHELNDDVFCAKLSCAMNLIRGEYPLDDFWFPSSFKFGFDILENRGQIKGISEHETFDSFLNERRPLGIAKKEQEPKPDHKQKTDEDILKYVIAMSEKLDETHALVLKIAKVFGKN